jgi:8-oxo-dGTP diphosphatase
MRSIAPEPIQVVAAAIEDELGRILITRRHDHTHQGGLWEFPGGKLEAGEAPLQGLERELREELGILPLDPEPLIRITHHYEDRSVVLDVYRVSRYAGEPKGMEGQPLNWLSPEAMEPEAFPAADRPVINALRLPPRYLISGGDPEHTEQFLERLDRSLKTDLKLLQLRAHELTDEAYLKLAETVLPICHRHQARVLINRPGNPSAWLGLGDGIHLNRHQLMAISQRPANAHWVGASCHDPSELARAEALGLDYALLSPVLRTVSHPQAQPLGWERFRHWVERVNLPVYALGGMGWDDMLRARQHGAQGVAGISGFWASC